MQYFNSEGLIFVLDNFFLYNSKYFCSSHFS